MLTQPSPAQPVRKILRRVSFTPLFRTDIDYPPLVKPVKKTKASLTASQSANTLQVNLNERFSEVMATVTQQYLQKRWNSLVHPDKWDLNIFLDPKRSPLKKKILAKLDHEHVHRALILSQYDRDFAKELLETALASSDKDKQKDDEDEEDEESLPPQSSSSTSSASTPPAPLTPLPPHTPQNMTLQAANLPGSTQWIDLATPWMTRAGVFFNCDQCGARITTVAWVCSVCQDYDLCDSCHSLYVGPLVLP